MKKTLKTKVLAGTVTVALLSSAGFAFASTDAGAKFQNWYNGAFSDSADSIGDQVLGYVGDQAPALAAEYQGIRAGAENSINFTRDTSIAVAQSNITGAKAAHVTAVNNAKDQILGQMEGQFDQLYADGLEIIDYASTEAFRLATNDLTNLTGTTGNAALGAVETDLNAAKDTAVGELQAAIDAAKLAVNNKIATEESATVAELKVAVDAAINDLRNDITELRKNLVQEQRDLITAKAIELENKAKADLDAVVNGI